MHQKILSPAVSLIICFLLYFGNVLSTLPDTALDFLFRVRGSREISQSIVIIGIDEQTLDKLGAWPFPRDIHASLLKQLTKAKVIGFDLLFSDAASKDTALSSAIKLAPPTVLAEAHDYTHALRKPNTGLSGFYGSGHIETILGNNGIIRETQLYLDSQIPAFSLVMLDAAGQHLQVSAPSLPRLINFYGPEFTFLYLSYLDVLQGKISADFFKDRFVLIGAQALGLGDVHITPFIEKNPMPGVEVQATILNNLLDDNFLRSSSGFSLGIILIFLLMSIFIWPRATAKRNLVLNAAATFLLIISSFWLFYKNVFFDPSIPIFFLIVTYLVHLVIQGLWVTRKLVKEITGLDHQLETGLHGIYTNIPSRLIYQDHKKSGDGLLTGGLRRHIARMHSSIMALELQNHFINNLLKEEVAPLILWELKSGTVILANSMFRQFWQQQYKESTPLPDLQQFLTFLGSHRLSDGTALPESVAEIKESDRKTTIDIRLQLKGHTRYYQVNLHGVEDPPSSFSGFLANISDVTEVRELERMKSDLVGTVSHELRQPLTTILGYSEMLTEILDNESKQYALEICSQSKRLNKLIENFLDIARIENAGDIIRKFPFDIVIVVEDSINAVTHNATEKSITLQVDIPYKVTPLIGDELLLLQSLINVLDNAIKFSPEDTSVHVKVIEENDVIMINISDQGPGISEDDHEMIFKKFNRGNRQHDQEGFGLGLNLVKQVIDGHNGTINILASEETGTTFSITLPKSQDK